MRLGADRILVALAALAGLLGVALSAVATHAALGPNLDIAARFLLIHAAAVLGGAALIVSGLLAPRLARLALALMLFGLALFAGDLALRAFQGVPLAALAAPTGGIMMMAGWMGLALAAMLPSR